jgi:putative FmdB family regulatory protein
MPIYDFCCRACGHTFEALVRKTEPSCPNCSSLDLERLLSLPTVKSEGTKARALSAARQRDKRLGEDRVQAQREYERNHD